MQVMSAIRGRMRRAVLLARREASSLRDDVRLFSNPGNGVCAFRQSTIDDMNMLVRADEDVGRTIYFQREFEPQESAFLGENVRESDICVDVGANVGFYTLCLAKRASRGRVHSFEPVPLNFHVLALNVLANRLTNVVINDCAVGDANAEVDFCIAQDGAFSSLIDTGRKTVIETTKISMVTLDSYCSEHNLPRIDILKVDVEGAEPAVLRGAEGLLAHPERRPRLVMLELYEPMLRQFGHTIAEVAALMRKYEYEAFVFVEGELVQFAELHYNKFYNVLFLGPGCDQPHVQRGGH